MLCLKKSDIYYSVIIEKILEQHEATVMFQANPNCQNVLVYSVVYFIVNSSDARAFFQFAYFSIIFSYKGLAILV